jgi:hypothetical protein
MKFIELRDGLSVCADEIEAVIRNEDGMTSTVYTTSNTYTSTFPYEVLLSLLERQSEEPEQKQELNILKTLGSFAG